MLFYEICRFAYRPIDGRVIIFGMSTIIITIPDDMPSIPKIATIAGDLAWMCDVYTGEVCGKGEDRRSANDALLTKS